MNGPIIRHVDVAEEEFPGGATYRTLVGDDAGSTPVRCGIQTSPPGYATPNHAHPYVEIVTVLEGTGEAWIDGLDGTTEIGPGMTMVFPRTRHTDSESSAIRLSSLTACILRPTGSSR